MVDLVSPFIKWCEGSCHDYGRLKGAYAMAAAGVCVDLFLMFFSSSHMSFQIELAFGMYHTGECVDVGQFSRELVGEIIDDYAHNAAIMSQRRWANLMDICGAPDPEDRQPIPGSSSMQQRRRTLYVPSSPAKEE